MSIVGVVGFEGVDWADNSELKVMVFVTRALRIGLQNDSCGRPIPSFSARALSHMDRTLPASMYPIWVSSAS